MMPRTVSGRFLTLLLAGLYHNFTEANIGSRSHEIIIWWQDFFVLMTFIGWGPLAIKELVCIFVPWIRGKMRARRLKKWNQR